MFKFLYQFGIFGYLVAIFFGCLMAWFIAGVSARWNPEAREKEFQSTLAECEQMAAKHGDKWQVMPDYCRSTLEEYYQRLDDEEKRQAIDKAAQQNIRDGTTPEPPNTE